MKYIVPILSLSLFVAPSLSLAVESASHLADASDRASTGKLLHCDPSREACLAWERANLQVKAES